MTLYCGRFAREHNNVIFKCRLQAGRKVSVITLFRGKSGKRSTTVSEEFLTENLASIQATVDY
jgi:hypothetical protein